MDLDWSNVHTSPHQFGFLDVPTGDPKAPPGPGPLLPELAQLEWLRELWLVRSCSPWWAGAMPNEWVQPGAFRRLRQ